MIACGPLKAAIKETIVSSQTVVITGANSGIGYQSALHFAQQNAHVIMACRSVDKAEQARNRILEQTPHGRLSIIRLDVSDLESVHEFARHLDEECGQLDLLINNAGIVAMPLSRNEAGHESQLATNYLGAFALTGLLLPKFTSESHCRIVNVGSLAHRLGKLNLSDLNWEKTEYDEWKGYANSKVAMLSHTLELDRRLRAIHSPVIALAAHPGFELVVGDIRDPDAVDRLLTGCAGATVVPIPRPLRTA